MSKDPNQRLAHSLLVTKNLNILLSKLFTYHLFVLILN